MNLSTGNTYYTYIIQLLALKYSSVRKKKDAPVHLHNTYFTVRPHSLLLPVELNPAYFSVDT